MDTRFSSAIHILILISEAEKPLSSEHIASSVGTNASYIRKITGLLKKGKIIESKQGVSGFKLRIPAEELSFYKIYCAVYESDQYHVFDMHQNPNDECIVGRRIKPVLTEQFTEIEEKAMEEFKRRTLADVIESMKNYKE
ncbi:Rrf2 family transcriptional regulator [Lachnospiraceae bacterium C1.1]|nr:Rrf2 family transcriptional regulator [Lachnospiraceae bacterium C1.1]